MKSRSTGSVLMEFAICVPVIFVLFWGLYDFSFALQNRMKMSFVARQLARFAVARAVPSASGGCELACEVAPRMICGAGLKADQLMLTFTSDTTNKQLHVRLHESPSISLKYLIRTRDAEATFAFDMRFQNEWDWVDDGCGPCPLQGCGT